MASTATAPPAAPGEATTAELLVELGQLRQRVEEYQDRDRQRERTERAKADALAANDIRRQPKVKIRFTRNCQGKTFIGDRVYPAYKGPIRDRSTNRITRYGQVVELPADDARCFVEADYAEVLDGEQHIRWTHEPPVPLDAAPAPHPDDDREWERREVR